MEKLRDEIIEAQKVRADLIKWKLVLVSTLGAVGLGLNSDKSESKLPVLCLIPFVCIYVDLQARHLNLRMQVIGSFIRGYGEKFTDADPKYSWIQRYEAYCCQMNGLKVFDLETSILTYSTVALSVLVMLAGGYVLTFLKADFREVIGVLLVLSGVFGVLSAVSIDHMYRRKAKVIDPTTGS